MPFYQVSNHFRKGAHNVFIIEEETLSTGIGCINYTRNDAITVWLEIIGGLATDNISL